MTPARRAEPSLRLLMLLTDVGFVLYWLVTALHLIPARYAYSDAHDPMVVAWNWSFLPLDLLVSATGLTGLWLDRRGRGDRFVTLSLALTVCSGLQALSFWAMRCQFDATWWALNGFLLLYPVPYLAKRLLRAPLDAPSSSPV